MDTPDVGHQKFQELVKYNKPLFQDPYDTLPETMILLMAEIRRKRTSWGW